MVAGSGVDDDFAADIHAAVIDGGGTEGGALGWVAGFDLNGDVDVGFGAWRGGKARIHRRRAEDGFTAHAQRAAPFAAHVTTVNGLFATGAHGPSVAEGPSITLYRLATRRAALRARIAGAVFDFNLASQTHRVLVAYGLRAAADTHSALRLFIAINPSLAGRNLNPRRNALRRYRARHSKNILGQVGQVGARRCKTAGEEDEECGTQEFHAFSQSNVRARSTRATRFRSGYPLALLSALRL